MDNDKIKRITLPCDCDKCVFVIEKSIWDDNEISYSLTIQEPIHDKTIWGRVKGAVRALFGKSVPFNDAYLEDKEKFNKLIEDMKELEKWEPTA